MRSWTVERRDLFGVQLEKSFRHENEVIGLNAIIGEVYLR